MSSTDTRERARRGEGAALRDELLDAAEALLIEKGSMDGVSIRAIVDAVGVTPPSMYLHFDDKDDLFFDVCSRRFEDFHGVLAAAIEGIEDPVERLRALGRAYVTYGVERAEHYQILFAPHHHSVVKGRDLTDGPGMQAFGLLVTTIQDGIDAGVLRECDPYQATMAIWAGVHGAVMISAMSVAEEGGPEVPDAEAFGAGVCDMLLEGLIAR